MSAGPSAPDCAPTAPAGRRLSLADRRYDILAGAVLVLVSAAGGWVFRHYAPDDAFITYRFARNLALGLGFVFNPGEPILGTSTPLYTLLLAGVHRLTGVDIPLLSNLVGVASLAGASVLLYRLGRDHDRRLALVAALLFVTNPILLASLGMETLFLLLCQMAAVAAFVGGKRAAAAILLGMLFLLRYEMALFAGLLAFTDWLQSRRIPWWTWPAGVLAGSWLLFAQIVFGQVIPQSALAKLTAPRLPFLVGGLVIWDIYARQLQAYYLLLILAVLGIYSLARTRLARLAPAYRILLTWGGLYLFAAGIAAGSFPWYYAPLVPAVAILVGSGIAVLIEMLGELAPDSRAQLLTTTAFVILLGGMGLLNIAAWTQAWVIGPRAVVDQRVLAYQQLSAWLGDNAAPQASLASFEIGAIGYFSDLYIIDLAGLITPEVLPLVKDPDRAGRLQAAIIHFEPDFILVPPDLVETFRFPGADVDPVHSFGGIDLYASPD